MIIKEEGYQKEKTEFFGSKFCIGNGYFGYRGTLEEYGKSQLSACTLSEIFDDNGSGWREPVNIPNGLYTYISYQGKEVSVIQSDITSHKQILELDKGLHKRETVFLTEDGKTLKVEAERFAYRKDLHLLVMRYCVTARESLELDVITALDSDIWYEEGVYQWTDLYQKLRGKKQAE